MERAEQLWPRDRSVLSTLRNTSDMFYVGRRDMWMESINLKQNQLIVNKKNIKIAINFPTNIISHFNSFQLRLHCKSNCTFVYFEEDKRLSY